jgi:hypothetical protein
MSDQSTLSDKPCGATADWILGYLANECSLDMGCVSPADFLAITNAIHNHEIDEIASLRAQLITSKQRVTALEVIISEDLLPSDCSDDLNMMLVKEIHDRRFSTLTDEQRGK